jgi:hypothetical protein
MFEITIRMALVFRHGSEIAWWIASSYFTMGEDDRSVPSGESE